MTPTLSPLPRGTAPQEVASPTAGPAPNPLTPQAGRVDLDGFHDLVFWRLRELQNLATLAAFACEASTFTRPHVKPPTWQEFDSVMGETLQHLAARIGEVSEELCASAAHLIGGRDDVQP